MKKVYEAPRIETVKLFKDDILFASPQLSGNPQEFDWGELDTQ